MTILMDPGGTPGSFLLDSVNCIDATEGLKKLDEYSVDLIIADPPYGVGKEDWDILQFAWLKEAFRVLKGTGSFYVFGSVWWYPIVHVKAMEIGFRPRNILVWFYENAMARQRKNFQMQYDPIGFFTKSDFYTFNLDAIRLPYKTERVKSPVFKRGRLWRPNPLGKKAGNVLDIPALAGALYKKERTWHPTQKPEKLIEVLVKASSNQDDLVVDPFVGSGTTAVVAKKLNRHFIGFDSEIRCITTSRERLANVTSYGY